MRLAVLTFALFAIMCTTGTATVENKTVSRQYQFVAELKERLKKIASALKKFEDIKKARESDLNTMLTAAKNTMAKHKHEGLLANNLAAALKKALVKSGLLTNEQLSKLKTIIKRFIEYKRKNTERLTQWETDMKKLADDTKKAEAEAVTLTS